MKKIKIMVIVLLPILFILSGCSKKEFGFSTDDVAKIYITDGLTGDVNEITDSGKIEEIINNLNSLELDRGKSSENYSGYKYRLRFENSDGYKNEDFYVNSDCLVNYNGYFYDISGDNKIDLSLLE